MIDAETARQIAVKLLRELGSGAEPVLESWLVKKGYIVGRRYWAGSLSAVWFCDADEMKVYDQAGKVLKVVAVTEMRKAA